MQKLKYELNKYISVPFYKWIKPYLWIHDMLLKKFKFYCFSIIYNLAPTNYKTSYGLVLLLRSSQTDCKRLFNTWKILLACCNYSFRVEWKMDCFFKMYVYWSIKAASFLIHKPRIKYNGLPPHKKPPQNNPNKFI